MKLAIALTVLGVFLVFIGLYFLNASNLQKIEFCKPNFYVQTVYVASGLKRIDCMTKDGKVESFFLEDK